jgi:hypothetical protein
MAGKIGLVALTVVLGLCLATAAGANNGNGNGNNGGTSINNGGGTPNCGAACDQSHNPTDYEKPCAPVPGNGCHTLPDTPCERGHGGTEIGNKHCGPVIEIRKEQSECSTLQFTHDPVSATLFQPDFCYRITVTSLSSTSWTLSASDPLCDQSGNVGPLQPQGPQTLPANGSFVYTCEIDPVPGEVGIPSDATVGGGPYPVTNTVSVLATPNDNSGAVTLTDSVTANFS